MISTAKAASGTAARLFSREPGLIVFRRRTEPGRRPGDRRTCRPPSIKQAGSPSVGLDRALSGRFRLILLDQRLASIDCVGVYRRIRNYTPLPVLALPGPAAASGPSPLLDALADPWLARQIDPEDFPAGPLSEADLLRLVRQRLARADSRD